MSLTRQIIIAVIATISLALFGISSYYASRSVFPDPSQGAATIIPTKAPDQSVPTVEDLKRLEPKNVKVTTDGDEVVVTFETQEQVGATVYVTPNSKEIIANVIKDYRNGVPIEGRWFTVTSGETPQTTHVLRMPSSVLAKSGTVYYYILISFDEYWLPYGASMDYINGPLSPFQISQ